MAQISAIVLAAGKSERMGRPKALLSIHGRTFLENILATIRLAKIADVVVVVGRHRDEILESIALPNVVFNPDYEQGMITSIQTGIRALSGASDGALLFLVDHPAVTEHTIETLVERFSPGRIVLPTYECRRGHPVLFSRGILDEILEVPVTAGANVVVRKDPSRIIEVPVEDSGVTFDVDTPEDYSRLNFGARR